jgi:cation diffusion facilitator family transporter
MEIETPEVSGASGDTRGEQRVRLRAGVIALVVGVVLLVAKFVAFQLTGSAAIFSDALESIVNVVAATFALGGLVFAGRPADRDHPYGHGKIEFFSAAFEGGLITFAAVAIVYEGVVTLLRGVVIQQLDLGLALTTAAGLANLALGIFLVRTGQRHRSLTLVADGQHVMSDFWTTAGVVVALLLVELTGRLWLDPAVAIAVGVNLAWTGVRLVRHAAGGLLDAVDTGLLQRVISALNANMVPGIIRVHRLRAIRAGRFTHIDAHLVVPEFWHVQCAHDVSEAFEARVIAACGMEGEIVFHTDPCRRMYCAQCDVSDCAIRLESFRVRPPLTIDEVVRPEQPPGPATA